MKKTLLFTSLGVLSLASAQVIPQEDNAAYREGYALILQEDWRAAQSYFSQFQLDWPDSPWLDDAAFWNCFAEENSSPLAIEQFQCYETFLQTYPQSSWASDAVTKAVVLGAQLSSRGYPDLLEQISFPVNVDVNVGNDYDYEYDYDFDFDSDEISESVERALEQAEREMERVQRRFGNVDMPDLPDRDAMVEMMRRDIEAARRDFSRSRRNRSRDTADDELLTILAALRDDQRASDLLIQNLDSSDSPELRARIVLLLEDINGDNVTSKLLDLLENDPSEQVRNNAMLVLLDRDDAIPRATLLEIVMDDTASPRIRAEIIDDMDDWEEDMALEALTELLRNEGDLRLIEEAADTLADIGSGAAVTVMMDNYDVVTSMEGQHVVLEALADIETPEVLNFLSNIALNSDSDDTAAIAIDSISEREDNVAVSALENVYLSTGNQQRRLAAIDGISDAESELAVEVLTRAFNATAEMPLQAEILQALGDTERESAVAVVSGAYRDSDDDRVKRAAIRALNDLDEFDSATDALLEILEQRLNEELEQ